MKAFLTVVALCLLAHVVNAAEHPGTVTPQVGDIIQISRNNFNFRCIIAAAAPQHGARMRDDEFADTLVRELKEGNVLLVADSNLLMRCTLDNPVFTNHYRVHSRDAAEDRWWSFDEEEPAGNILEISKSNMLFNCKAAVKDPLDRDNTIEVMKNNMLFECSLQAAGQEVERGWHHPLEDMDERESKMIEISESDLTFKCKVSAKPVGGNEDSLSLDRNGILQVMESNMLFKCTLESKE